MLVDTHCHIHETSYPLPIDEVIQRANSVDVKKLICVGTSQKSSEEAVRFATAYKNIFVSLGVHPHDATGGWGGIRTLLHDTIGATASRIVAIGEVGLDYFYSYSPREVQIEAFEAQIDLAVTYHLPLIFHVRNAFDDFWPILDNFHDIRGELHSFTDSKENLEEGLGRGLYVGVNGISTFTKDPLQKAMFASIPLSRLLLETDAPFLTPIPFRGKVNEPAFVRKIAEYQAQARHLSFEEIATTTTQNAEALFAIH